MFSVDQCHVWSDRAVARAWAATFEGVGSGSTPIMEEGMTRPSDLAESPSTDGSRKVAYARYGSVASANILCRALSNNS